MMDMPDTGWRCGNGHVQSTPDPKRPGRCVIPSCDSNVFVPQPLRPPKKVKYE